MIATFKEPSSKLQWGAMLSSYFEEKFDLLHVQLCASRHVTCLRLPQWQPSCGLAAMSLAQSAQPRSPVKELQQQQHIPLVANPPLYQLTLAKSTQLQQWRVLYRILGLRYSHDGNFFCVYMSMAFILE